MDPLAHGLTGSVVAVAAMPAVARRHTGRVIGAGALLGNLPDIDFATLAMGEEVWLYHHRGLTHSLLGLAFMVPAGMWILRKVVGEEATKDVGRGSMALCSLSCIGIGHILLDYLTSFGLMLLYPFSFERIAAGLMFIVDPSFWVVCVAGALLLGLKRFHTAQGLQRAAFGVLGAMVALWTAELAAKQVAVGIARQGWQQRGIVVGDIYAYPMVTAPMVWTVITESRGVYPQAVISMWPSLTRGEQPRTFFPPFPEEYRAGELCDDLPYGIEAISLFERYNAWGHPVVCAPHVHEGVDGCRCFGLKYSIAADRRARFGAYWISPGGKAHVLAPETHPDDEQLFMSLF